MLRVMIVDDEPLARQGLRQLLGVHPEVSVVAEAAKVSDAKLLIEREKPEALFLDIRMPGLSGFDLLKSLHEPPKVVFVTAYSQHAVEAFEVNAVDYLLKPVMPERLAAAIRRLRGGDDPYSEEDRICLRTPERTVIAKMEGIPLLQAEDDFTRVFVLNEQPLLIGQTLSSFERQLPAPPFLRLDRSHLVNVSAIQKWETLSRDEGRLHLNGLPTPLPLGRAAQARLRQQFNSGKREN
ncbi:MAG: response regulator transcription factor [Chthoniobacterales bacterium]